MKKSFKIESVFTDMYFDLKFGLGLLESDSAQAINVWQCSFYMHWGQHLARLVQPDIIQYNISV